MDLANSIAQASMTMGNTRLQQGIQTSMMKKAMETSTDMIKGIMQMADSVPKFSGEVGSMLDVRA